MSHPPAVPARALIVAGRGRPASTLEPRLATLGCEVVTIVPPDRDAVDAVAELAPRVVLIDAALDGDVDGIDAARAIRRRSPVPILVLADESDDAALRRLGAVDWCGYLLTPVADRELRVALAMALDEGAAAVRGGELEERFFDVALDMLCCLGFDGHFRRLSPSWERTLGFTREELMARPFIEFVHPDDRERTLAQNRAVRAGGQAILFENRYRCRDGSYRWLLWNASPYPAGRVIYSVARDVTDRKRAEQEREELVAQLQTALAEVRTLRALLSICSYCKRIRDEDDHWQSVESYIARHTDTRFSHGICPTCFEQHVEPQLNAPPQPQPRP